MHFSSSVVYGHREKDSKMMKESDLGVIDQISKRSSYDEGKRFAEAMVVNYRDAYKLDTRIARLFRVYGPRMKLGDGQMIPDFIDCAIDGRELVIYGNKEFSSSFCYVSDAVDATLKLMDANINSPVNIGSDLVVNLSEIAAKIIAMTRSQSTVRYADGLLFMRPLHIPDIAKARNELGWMPVITLEQGLERTIYELRAAKGIIGVNQAL
jgi:nucleoside-diphosphate-sugar epimerase